MQLANGPDAVFQPETVDSPLLALARRSLSLILTLAYFSRGLPLLPRHARGGANSAGAGANSGSPREPPDACPKGGSGAKTIVFPHVLEHFGTTAILAILTFFLAMFCCCKIDKFVRDLRIAVGSIALEVCDPFRAMFLVRQFW